MVSVLSLLALSGIQAYLINNTYTLEKDDLIDETTKAVNGIRNNSRIDSLQNVWRQALTRELFDYRENDLSKAAFINRIIAIADSLSPLYNNFYQEKLQDADLGYDLKFKKNLTRVVIFDGSKTDTVFAAGERDKIKLFGENFEEEEEALTTHVSTWYAQEEFRSITDTSAISKLKFEVASEDLILIEDQISILFRRLAGLFVISILIFLFVVGLLFYSIKNLITQKKIAEIKTDFVNNITHEFKTPLATLGIATKSLNTKEIINSPSALNNTLKIVDRQNNRLQELLDQVMNNSLSSKEIVLNKEQVAAGEYFRDIIEDFRISVLQKNLILKTEIQPNERTLELDKFHFTTAIKNILDNAVKYREGESEILFTTKLNHNSYVIEISDNGSGISKKDQVLIFNKFYRVNSGNLHNTRGMGLGLYYTKQIIEAHKGSIAVQSELEKGSCFTIKIPLA